MAGTNRFEQGVSEALGIFPTPESIASERFRQAFDGITPEQEAQILRELSQLLQKVIQSLIKFGSTAIYDEDIRQIVTDDDESMKIIAGDGRNALPDELIAFRRGALRDLVAMELRGHGYSVTRKVDGASRLVVRLVPRTTL